MSDTQRATIKYTNQEVFNLVAFHLFTQGERSSINNKCRYRGPRGLKCAVGVLIPDSMYLSSMEGDTIHGIWRYKEIPYLFANVEQNLLRELQRIHDEDHYWRDTVRMKSELACVAAQFNLDPIVLNNLSFSDR